MNVLYVGFVMGIIFLLICLTQIFHLQKEIRKLNKITSYLLNKIKSIKNKNE